MKYKTTVIATTTVEGFHRWPNHEGGAGFLADRHRHLFTIKMEAIVYHDDRDIEFIAFARSVKDTLHGKFGEPCEFGTMSCEAIAKCLIDIFYPKADLVSVEVWEDLENGARVELL